MAYRYRGEAGEHVIRELSVIRIRDESCSTTFHAYTEFCDRKTGKKAIVFLRGP